MEDNPYHPFYDKEHNERYSDTLHFIYHVEPNHLNQAQLIWRWIQRVICKKKITPQVDWRAQLI
jgi:hypothetical protein